MKPNVFIAKLTRGAVATALVGAASIPPHHSTGNLLPPLKAQTSAFPAPPILPEPKPEINVADKYFLTMPHPPNAWNNKLEREFRALALEEAISIISKENARRLEELSYWREQLLNPKTVEEILAQMKRDNLLNRMEKLLKEYVEFQEAANQKGLAA